MLDLLRQEQVDPSLIEGVIQYRNQFSGSEKTACTKSGASGADTDASEPLGAVPDAENQPPRFFYYGKEVWNEALSALLCGQNLLLVGSKATGKNVLCENLAAVFGRPSWNLSFHINMDASYMIGTDTFQNGRVEFRPGPVYRAAKAGGFCILDEINMARNEALAVLHSVLDFRHMIEVPGYERIAIHPAARFIATMNYGYAGTRELNEALLSRFAVIRMPDITEENLIKLLHREFPDLRPEYEKQFAGIFMDIEKKYQNGEIGSSLLDLRGLIDAIGLIRLGLSPRAAFDMGITNKSFESFEQNLLRDILYTRISDKADKTDIFTS